MATGGAPQKTQKKKKKNLDHKKSHGGFHCTLTTKEAEGDSWRPSLTTTKRAQAAFVKAQNIYRTITCTMCNKPRSIYRASAVLGRKHEANLQTLIGETQYHCSMVFPGSAVSSIKVQKKGEPEESVDVNMNTVFETKPALSCLAPVEWTLYTFLKDKKKSSVCGHCGVTSGLVENADLKEEYSSVQKVCQRCLDRGLQHPVKGKFNRTLLGKRKTTASDGPATQKRKLETKDTSAPATQTPATPIPATQKQVKRAWDDTDDDNVVGREKKPKVSADAHSDESSDESIFFAPPPRGIRNDNNVTCFLASLCQSFHAMKDFQEQLRVHTGSNKFAAAFQNLSLALATGDRRTPVGLGDVIEVLQEDLGLSRMLMVQSDIHEFFVRLLALLPQSCQGLFQGRGIQFSDENPIDLLFTDISVPVSRSLQSSLHAYFHASVQTHDKTHHDVVFQRQLTKTPLILAVYVSRWIGNEKDHRGMDIPFTIDLAPFLAEGVTQQTKYKLNSVCVHIGEADYGHYVTYAQNTDGGWLYCNDSAVSTMRVKTVKEKIRSGYLLFFLRTTE